MDGYRSFLPFAKPLLGQEEIDEVVDTMRSGWLTTGKKCIRFESLFSEFVGVKHALTVSSATAGLHLALEAVGVGPGDKVITSPYTFTATAEVIRYLGADPVFADIDPQTFNIHADNVQRIVASGEPVKAIMPVHFAGQACEMSRLKSLAVDAGIPVVEDAAHALPATCDGKLVGGIGDITVFSFYVTKTIATGEGGMVTTDNSDYCERMKVMRLHGISRDVFDRYSSDKPSWYYEVVAPGYKYNMTDISASIGIHQLNKAWSFQKRRQTIADRYNEAFVNLPLRLPHIADPDTVHSWHLYVVQLDLESLSIDRDRFIELMSEAGVGTSVHFIPLHMQPYWKNRYDYEDTDFPVATDVYNRAVSLPIYPGMSDDDIDHVIQSVSTILGGNSR